MNNTRNIALSALRIFMILMIIGILIPHILNLVLELLPLTDTTDPPKGNSTFVLSRYLRNNIFLYYLRRVTKLYFTL